MKKLTILLASVLLVAFTVFVAGCGKSNFEGKWVQQGEKSFEVVTIEPGRDSDTYVVKKQDFRYEGQEEFINKSEYEKDARHEPFLFTQHEGPNLKGILPEYLETYTLKAGTQKVVGTATERDHKLYVQGASLVYTLGKDDKELISSDGGASLKAYSEDVLNAVKSTLQTQYNERADKLNKDYKDKKHYTIKFVDDAQSVIAEEKR